MSAKKRKESRTEKGFENIEEALTSTERFLDQNQRSIVIGLIIVILLVGAYLAYHYLIKLPRDEKAQTELFKGERYFQQEDDSLALFGNGNDYIGFESIASRYKGTKTANLAHAYAGISYSRMGDDAKALEHLNKFKGKDLLLTPAVTGAIGDVYMNMGETDKAVSQFLKAAKEADNEMLSPIYYKKAGVAYLSVSNYDKAIETFQLIKDNYLNSPEAQEADKFLMQAKLLKGESK